jgi:hypothetical protein
MADHLNEPAPSAPASEGPTGDDAASTQRVVTQRSADDGAPASNPDDLPPVKLIFLDVDGVICCNGYGRLEEEKLQRIKTIVEKTEAKVVLSTDWRRDATLKATITAALAEKGAQVIGATRKGAPLKPIRPQEITQWLDHFVAKRTVSEWVAVDDRDLISEMGRCLANPNRRA